MYLSDLRVYFKVDVYFRVTWSRMEEWKKKLVDYANTNKRWIHCSPEGFIPWLINLGLFANF